MKSLVRRIRDRLAILGELRLPFRQVSFSDSGEDLVVTRALRLLGINQPRYIDIGTNHPVRFNNTYAFYRAGSLGVCIEPNPSLGALIRKFRPRDLLLPVGVTGGTGGQSLRFYSFDNPGVSTFSPEHAAFVEKSTPYRVREVIEIPVVNVNEVFEQAIARVGACDFVSLDTEGLDVEILGGLDFTRFRPAIFCIETALPGADDNNPSQLPGKVPGITELMAALGYQIFADTNVNTIFADSRRFRFPGTTPL